MALKEYAQARGGSRVTALRGAAIGGFGSGQVTLLFEQDAATERCRGVAAFICATEGGSRAWQVAPRFEYDPELEGGLRMTADVRTRVRATCTGQIAFLFKQ